jgi:hypothetical protein
LKLTTQTTAGIRTGCFSNTVLFLKEVLNLEIAHYDQEKEFARFQFPSGEILEVFGSKHLWQPFTTSPAWEVIIADVRHRKEKSNGEKLDAQVADASHADPQEAPDNLPNDLTQDKNGNSHLFI